MSKTRASQILKQGRKLGDYVCYMTYQETDFINSLGYPQNAVLRRLALGGAR